MIEWEFCEWVGIQLLANFCSWQNSQNSAVFNFKPDPGFHTKDSHQGSTPSWNLKLQSMRSTNLDEKNRRAIEQLKRTPIPRHHNTQPPPPGVREAGLLFGNKCRVSRGVSRDVIVTSHNVTWCMRCEHVACLVPIRVMKQCSALCCMWLGGNRKGAVRD